MQNFVRVSSLPSPPHINQKVSPIYSFTFVMKHGDREGVRGGTPGEANKSIGGRTQG